MSRKLNVYALYKGDEFIDLGTIEELSKKHNYKPESLRHWRTKSYIERNKARKEVEGRKILIKIEEDEEEI